VLSLTGNETPLPNECAVPLASPTNYSEAVAPAFRTMEQIISPEKEWYSKYLFDSNLKQQKSSWEAQINNKQDSHRSPQSPCSTK